MKYNYFLKDGFDLDQWIALKSTNKYWWKGVGGGVLNIIENQLF